MTAGPPRLHLALPHEPFMVSAGTSPADLQQHLYTSLLQGHTADVALRVRGSWEAVYQLHRVVLIQAVSRAERDVEEGTKT
jgi:hypothetical protein